jgi:rare lipoprotein A
MAAGPGTRVEPFIHMRRTSRHLGLAVVVVAISSCAGSEDAVSRTPATTTGGPGPYSDSDSDAPSTLGPSSGRALEAAEGYASYYGRGFDGQTTASGTVFDNRALIAAHPAYPFGTVVRVTNLGNQRSVDVEIVDRGPSPAVRARGVIIDVSNAAARRLDLIEAGRARVRVEVLSWGR